MSDPQATAQPTKVGTPEHLEPQTVKCSQCGTVYFVGALHICTATAPLTPYGEAFEQGRQQGLREAAEIAREHERTTMRWADASTTETAKILWVSGSTASALIAEAIEAAAKGGQK